MCACNLATELASSCKLLRTMAHHSILASNLFLNPASLSGLLLAGFAMMLVAYAFRRISMRKSRLPPGPRAWPIIGSLHLLLGGLPHVNLANLSRKYGPIFYLRLGSMPTVVVSWPSLAKDFLQTNDQNFSDRPYFGMTDHLLYGRGNGIIFLSYGPRWRQIRKICALELFTQKQLQECQHIRIEEVDFMLENIEKECRKRRASVIVSKYLGTLSGNIISRMLITKRLFKSGTGGAELQEIVEELATLALEPIIGDFIPYLGWLDVVVKRRMSRAHKRADMFLEGILGDRMRNIRKRQGEVASEKGESPGETACNDFLEVLLSNSETVDAASLDSIKSTLLEMFGGGIDTTTVTLEWALAELLRHPQEMKKLQDEIDSAVGSMRESDLPHLNYMKAVIKEVFRLHPPLALMLPHAAKEASEVVGYKLPAKTRLLVNVWAIGRDPSVWEQPEEFRPERFVGSSVDYKGQHFELLPFGSGRRGCPGMSLGVCMVELTLANLVHSFDWAPPNGQRPQDVDMSEKFGGAISMANPLFAVPQPRLNM